MGYQPFQMPRGSAPTLLRYQIENFLGLDKRNKPANVEPYRTPGEGPKEKNVYPNLIRDGDKKVSKDIGWEVLSQHEGRVNGRHYLKSAGKEILHIGTGYYLAPDMETPLWTGADERSCAVEYKDKLWMMDGQRYVVFGKVGSEWKITPVDGQAYVPTILIQCAPAGGGTEYEDINLLSNRYKVEFLGDETSKTLVLPVPLPQTGAVTVEVSNTSGGRTALVEGTDFTLDREKGTIALTQAHPPVVAQRGNIFVEAPADFAGYRELANEMRMCIQYDVGGATSRLVCSRGTDNISYYSGFEDYSYLPEFSYIEAGQDSSETMCYSIQGTHLLVHKRDDADSRNTFAFSAEWDGEQTLFRLTGQYQGSGAASRYTVAYGGSEPMFFTGKNIHAITPTGVLGEQMSQSRSDYITPMLESEQSPEEAVAIYYDGFYKLFLNGHVYSLDTTQSSYGSLPFSHRQYECYARDNVPARCVWEGTDGRLYFGTSDGRVCAFFKDKDILQNYKCGETPIHAKWYTNEFYGTRADLRKTFESISVLLGAYPQTGVRLTAFYDGEIEVIRDYDGAFSYFVYSQFDYSRMSYKGDTTPQSAKEDLRIRKVGKIQFLLENDRVEPFTLYSMIAEYFQVR